MKRELLLLLFALFMSGCKPSSPTAEVLHEATDVENDCPAIYHWKTTYDPTSFEKEFISTHNIKRLYLRFFDVDYDISWVRDDLNVIPIATTTFKQTPPPEIEVVPTIYITLEAMRRIGLDGCENYAEMLVKRVLAMMSAHEISNVKQVQLDCDWTASTRDIYFEFCRCVKQRLIKNGLLLSSTIRLHQLLEQAPPVDKGVLMLYNTGSLVSSDTKNSILDYNDVLPYINRSNYDYLELDFAYPTFSWSVWFRNGRFMAIIRNIELDDKTYYEPIDENNYRVVSDHFRDSNRLLKGDIIRLEESDIEQVMKVKSLVDQKWGDKPRSSIIYHLDSTNLSKYSKDEIQAIYKNN